MNGDQIANKCKFQIVYGEGEEEAVGVGVVTECDRAGNTKCKQLTVLPSVSYKQAVHGK